MSAPAGSGDIDIDVAGWGLHEWTMFCIWHFELNSHYKGYLLLTLFLPCVVRVLSNKTQQGLDMLVWFILTLIHEKGSHMAVSKQWVYLQ